ncbi:MAG: hypothetical protein R3D00_08650 [Bacteroidia bacterium]
MEKIHLKYIWFLFVLIVAGRQNVQSQTGTDGIVTIHPDKYKQTMWGIGFEIQSDAIGSGNTGLPENKHSVPHDLTPAERKRLSKEMLKGFRYCRLAGGLYWRGTDPEGKYLKPRWPEQLEEIRQMIEWAGVEGVSLEYWSPPPYWKANNNYIGKGRDDLYNTLRCFGPDFTNDPVYHGDTTRFLEDYAEACARDIRTLQQAGIKTVQWGMSNEPFVSNASYSTCKFFSEEDYVSAYTFAAEAVRKTDPSILLISDTEAGFPHKIAKGIHRPEVAALVDAYVVHTIGWDSESVNKVHKDITEKLPKRPWFQNEYEYLKGGATPERCLNTAQHIMNSFQLGENPAWYWIHALKPFKNAEASGYSLGFWKSLEDTASFHPSVFYERWVSGPEITLMPEAFSAMEFITALRPSHSEPGRSFSFELNQSATVYLVVEEKGNYVPEGWEKTELVIKREMGTDVVYKKEFPAGTHNFPSHTGQSEGEYGAPHACFIAGSNPASLKIQVGVNSPIKILSESVKLEKLAEEVAPGHWFFNDYNWNAVGSFVRHMPWDCKVLEITEESYNKDARVFAFEKPNGKRTIVVSNRSGKDYTFQLKTGVNSTWQSYRYTPWERGENTMGVKGHKQKGIEITTTLPHLSWEFWEEK